MVVISGLTTAVGSSTMRANRGSSQPWKHSPEQRRGEELGGHSRAQISIVPSHVDVAEVTFKLMVTGDHKENDFIYLHSTLPSFSHSVHHTPQPLPQIPRLF